MREGSFPGGHTVSIERGPFTLRHLLTTVQNSTHKSVYKTHIVSIVEAHEHFSKISPIQHID
jgi:hypothetical protein